MGKSMGEEGHRKEWGRVWGGGGHRKEWERVRCEGRIQAAEIRSFECIVLMCRSYNPTSGHVDCQLFY